MAMVLRLRPWPQRLRNSYRVYRAMGRSHWRAFADAWFVTFAG